MIRQTFDFESTKVRVEMWPRHFGVTRGEAEMALSCATLPDLTAWCDRYGARRVQIDRPDTVTTARGTEQNAAEESMRDVLRKIGTIEAPRGQVEVRDGMAFWETSSVPVWGVDTSTGRDWSVKSVVMTEAEWNAKEERLAGAMEKVIGLEARLAEANVTITSLRASLEQAVRQLGGHGEARERGAGLLSENVAMMGRWGR